MYQLIDHFIESAKEIDSDIFPFIANKDWVEGKPVYYSGPYWDDLEARELIHSVLKGKWAFLLEKRLISLSVSFLKSLDLNIQ